MKWINGSQFQRDSIKLNHSPLTQGVIEAIHEKTQAPYSLITFALLSMYSNLSQGIVDVEIFQGDRSSVSNFIWIVADSGVGKSTVYNLLMPPLRDFDKRCRASYEEKMLIFETAKEINNIQTKILKKRIKEAAEESNFEELKKLKIELVKLNKELTKPKRMELSIDDATPEVIPQRLSNGCGVLSIHSPEGASIADGRLMNSLAMLCKIWQGEPLTVDRVRSGSIHITDSRVCILLMSQKSVPEKLVKTKGESLVDIGFFPRCIFAFIDNNQGERKYSNVDIDNDPHYNQYIARAKAFLEIFESNVNNCERERVLVKFTCEARRYLNEIKDYLESNLRTGGRYEFAKGHGAKLLENIARTAAVLTQFELGFGAEIPMGILQDAERIVFFSSNQYLKKFEIYPDYIRTAMALSDYLKSLREDGQRYVIKSWLNRSTLRKFRTLYLLNEALDHLVQNSEIRLYTLPTGLVYIDLYPLAPFDQFMWEKFYSEKKISF